MVQVSPLYKGAHVQVDVERSQVPPFMQSVSIVHATVKAVTQKTGILIIVSTTNMDNKMNSKDKKEQ